MGTEKRWLPIASLAIVAILSRSASAVDRSGNHDPIEPVNRAIFWFNDQVDIYVLEPVAKGYDKITSDRVKRCVSNFFQNLRFPISAVNDLLQGKLVATGSDFGRFAVNTTVGLAGLFDPATDWGMEFHDEDLGQTFGYWGLPAGPYLVLPLWGPSNIRDAVGLAGDSAAAVYPWFVPVYYSIGAQGVKTINGRALLLREVKQLKEASVDYYSAVRNAYNQRRETLIQDRARMSQQEQEDLYTVDTNGGE
ncbi:MAG TPA: VacJ family lipoprotein [Candidatus Binatia bacterium]|nr:VacJ family lipoprotein [Candidatus Binatia bacterium]